MKNLRKHFEHELNAGVEKIPYKDLADEEALNVWFEQFCNAPKVPSYWLYRLQYYSDDEVQSIIKENNDRIPTKKSDPHSSKIVMASFYTTTDEYNRLDELHTEFCQLKKIEDKFYINDITKTPITEALHRIYKKRNNFFVSVHDNSTDRYREPQDVANSIIKCLEALPLSLAKSVIKDIENEDINVCIFIIREIEELELSEIKENKLKRMNSSLIRHLKDWESRKVCDFKIQEWCREKGCSWRIKAGLSRLLDCKPTIRIEDVEKKMFIKVRGLGIKSWEDFQALRGF